MFTTSEVTMQRMGIKEKRSLDKLIQGKMNINTNRAQRLLEKAHVSIPFESLLDQQGLSDEQLAKKMKEIVNRKPTLSVNDKTGTTTTNQTQVDANALNTIKIALQLKNKFKPADEDKKDEFMKLGEEQLDQLIAGGTDYLKSRGVIENIQEQEDTQCS